MGQPVWRAEPTWATVSTGTWQRLALAGAAGPKPCVTVRWHRAQRSWDQNRDAGITWCDRYGNDVADRLASGRGG